jgi:ribosome-associated protein
MEKTLKALDLGKEAIDHTNRDTRADEFERIERRFCHDRQHSQNEGPGAASQPGGTHDDDAISSSLLLGLPVSVPRRKGGPLSTTTLSRKTNLKPAPAKDRACLCARVASDHKARDIVVLDMRGITPLYDYFVIATGSSRRQIHTLAEEIDAAMHEAGDRRHAIEGYESSKWVVQDYGDIVVHVFDPPSREYYSLEDLWADAPRIDWEREA